MRSPWVAFLLLAACRDGSPPNEQPARRPAEDAPRERVFTPSPALVRSVGPYNIKSSGVGLYALGTEMRTILATLPYPRVELLDLEGIVKYSLVRADTDRILVGFESTGVASFIAVLAPEIATLEGGYGVGSPIGELRDTLGPEVTGPVARDPHLVELEDLPNARIVVDGDRVIAIVVAPDLRAPAPAAEDRSACGRASAVLAGPLPDPHGEEDAALAAYGCFTGSTPEVAFAESDEVVVYAGDPGRMRRATSVPVPGLLFAGALDIDRDGRHEIVSVAEKRSGDGLAARIVVWRGEGGKLTAVADKEVYRMTSGAAGWVGAKLKDVSFLLRVVSAGTSSVEVRGLYLHRGEDQVRTVAPLIPETVAVRPRRAVTSGAGTGGGPSGSADPGPPKEEPLGGDKAEKKAEPPPPASPTRGKKAGSSPGRAKRDASDM